MFCVTFFYLMLKNNWLHGLFRALHAYLCLARWQMRCNLPAITMMDFPEPWHNQTVESTTESMVWNSLMQYCQGSFFELVSTVIVSVINGFRPHIAYRIPLDTFCPYELQGCLGFTQNLQFQCYSRYKKWNLSPLTHCIQLQEHWSILRDRVPCGAHDM